MLDSMFAFDNVFVLSTACRCSASLAEAKRGGALCVLARVVTTFSIMTVIGSVFVFDNMFVFVGVGSYY